MINYYLYKISDWAQLAIGVASFVLFCAFVWKRKRAARRKLADDPSDEVVGSAEDLARAEAEAARAHRDVRAVILAEHELLERYSTVAGFTREFAEGQARRLREAGLPAEIHFQEALQAGVADFLLPQGAFELYVARGRSEEARALLR